MQHYTATSTNDTEGVSLQKMLQLQRLYLYVAMWMSW